MKNVVLQLPEAEKLTIQRRQVNDKTGKMAWKNYMTLDEPKARQTLQLPAGKYRWSVKAKEYNEFRV
ncbi:MAG: hypothetical protein JSW30_02610 [Dehalococcoidia bacterium]|nr:MAG: hypothetical protein JSW30_02610 [Dehalococcoidia bacterium]